MTPYLRLNLVRVSRSPAGRLALAMALLGPLALAAAARAFQALVFGGPAPEVESYAWVPIFVGECAAVAFAGYIAPSIIHEERAARRVGLLRASGIGVAAAVVQVLALDAIVAATLAAAGLVVGTAIALATGSAVQSVVPLGLSVALAGLVLGAAGIVVQGLLGRAAWLVVCGAASIVTTAGLVGNASSPDATWPPVLAVLAAVALVASLAAVLAAVLVRRLPWLPVEIWP